MTTIAASVEHGVMAADSKCVFGDTFFPCDKIFRLPDGSLLAVAGADPYTRPFVNQMMQGITPDLLPPPASDDIPDPEFSAILLNKDGLFIFDESYSSTKVNTGQYAIGTGGMPALSHLMDGDSPEEAVRKAIRVDNNSGLPVQMMTLKVEK